LFSSIAFISSMASQSPLLIALCVGQRGHLMDVGLRVW
jgi:hypothetical protein